MVSDVWEEIARAWKRDGRGLQRWRITVSPITPSSRNTQPAPLPHRDVDLRHPRGPGDDGADGEDFLVYDARSGDDITRSVLTQIIFEQENKAGDDNLLRWRSCAS